MYHESKSLLGALGDIAVGYLADKGRVWVQQHDMEMLDSVDRLERRPVFEP
jgi:hypothetical protein